MSEANLKEVDVPDCCIVCQHARVFPEFSFSTGYDLPLFSCQQQGKRGVPRYPKINNICKYFERRNRFI